MISQLMLWLEALGTLRTRIYVWSAYLCYVVWRLVCGYVGRGGRVCDDCVSAVEHGLEESYVFEHF
jgi:hypothetical protein